MANGIKWEIEQAIIDALGLNGQAVTEIVLKLAYDSVPTVTVTMDLHGDNEELVRSIRTFVGELTEVEIPVYKPEDYVLGEDVTYLFDVRKQRIAEADTGPMATITVPPYPTESRLYDSAYAEVQTRHFERPS